MNITLNLTAPQAAAQAALFNPKSEVRKESRLVKGSEAIGVDAK